MTPDSLHPLHGLLALTVYAGLVFGLFVWVWAGPVSVLDAIPAPQRVALDVDAIADPAGGAP